MSDRYQEPEDDGIPEAVVPKRPKPSGRMLMLALIPIILIVTIGNVTLWVFRPVLIKDHPLLLLAVSPSRTFMVLVQARLDAISYYTVVIGRSLLADPSYFFLGYWFGHRALAYIKKYSKDIGELAVKLEEWFPRFGLLLVFFFPHPIVMIMAGASTMSFWTFIAADFAGVLLGAIGVRELGWIVENQVNWLTDFNSKYWIPLTAFFILYVVYMLWDARRKGEGFQTPSSIRRELEGDDDDPPSHR